VDKDEKARIGIKKHPNFNSQCMGGRVRTKDVSETQENLESES
jgi:hypothetical protein